MLVKVHLNKLFLKQKFTISHGSYDYRDQLIVELSEKGQAGYGETVAIDYYGYKIEELEKEASIVSVEIEKMSTSISRNSFYNVLKKLLPTNPFLRAAFDTAFIDLQSKLSKKSVRNFINILSIDEVESSVTIGLSDSIKSVENKIEQGWPFFKIKIDKEESREEIMKMIYLAERSFGVDANGGLGLGQAQKAIELVHKYSGVYVEQLVNKQWTTEIEKLKFPQGVLHFADESITDLASAKRISKYYDGFVLKLTKCGGFTPTIQIIEYAKKQDKRLLAGCMTESSVGINHMLAILPMFDFADLDGAYLISNDDQFFNLGERSRRQLQSNGRFI